MEKIKNFWAKSVFNKIVVIFASLIIIGTIGEALGDADGDTKNSTDKTKLESKNEVNVIDFSNMAINEITAWCETNKVECYTKDEYSDGIAKGSFVSQSVSNGDKIYEGEDVTIIYSLGKEPSLSQKNALKSALSYLNFSAFSYTGLIKQLEYEKYPHEDAVYAVDNCGADWNEQAYKSGQSYLNYSSFSRQGLINQLKYEGFTQTQAEYAVNKIGL
jgi:hypothetical protein